MKLSLTFLDSLLYALGFFVRILRGVGYFVIRGQASFKILIMQILFTFVEAVGIGCLMALGLGATINILFIPLFTSVSQQSFIYTILIAIITRELGPILTAIIISARSATAIATEMAGMVISHEIEAYISIGVDPIEHLAVPRFLGVTISMILLNFSFSIFGLAGSFFVAQFFNPMPPSLYFGNILQDLSLLDLIISFVKSLISGMLISTVAIMHGLAAEHASTEIPIAGLRAVSSALVISITVQSVISVLYYLFLL
ncbi:MAG: ABC transporter permease [Treponema sp.]|jgi:phospholipid/cholesterol/gamma-HCH transport system permease protein|nr:ABC transporter permease [Treponema sp.]